MAVTNFHYITRMNSGFKVYILEGQPNLRSEDRFRHMSSDRVRMRPSHPIKRKHSSEQGWTLEERRERALSKSLVNSTRRFSIPESPTSTWSPTASPTHLIPSPVYSSPVMDEPLALIKKPRLEADKTESQSKSTTQIQIRPSVITRISSATKSKKQDCSHSTTVAKLSSDHVEEHFQRSLGVNYHKATSVSVSVDDHFAKALGDKWLKLKASSPSCHSSSSSSTSSPPSSPSLLHSPSYSPKRACKDSFSPTTTSQNFWPDK
ncbi:hypothetical protein DNTS_030432 [Danionella cerebrum]|uniref:Transcription cofactor vestigial-like protein 4 n=1 Tax=Danionella cerebrum TaxID=2873325 RepID=A0A553RJ43_9TELE|nr:hypothetical protein DNTS_030432 [Danionella translucida]